MTKETIRCGVLRSQKPIVHSNLIIRLIFILTSADNLHLVNFSGTNVEYQNLGGSATPTVPLVEAAHMHPDELDYNHNQSIPS